jgi:hypothetical protein
MTTTYSPFEIIPAAGKGVFILNFSNHDFCVYNLVVFGLHGEKIWEKPELRVSGPMELVIDLREITAGICVMIIESNRKTWVKKLVVNN